MRRSTTSVTRVVARRCRTRAGWGIRGRAALLAGMVPCSTACFASAPDIDPTTTSDGSSSSTSGEASEVTTAADSTGADLPNLLANGSFESWPASVPTSWIPTSTLTTVQTDDAPHDGVAAARLELTAYGELRQAVGLASPLVAGTEIAVEMAYRHTTGDTSPPGIDLHGTRESDGAEILIPAIVTAPFVGDGWTVGGGSVVVPEAVTALRISVVAGGVAPQTVDVDAVRLWILE